MFREIRTYERITDEDEMRAKEQNYCKHIKEKGEMTFDEAESFWANEFKLAAENENN